MADSPSFDVRFVTAGFTAADADTSITHDLGRVPLAAFLVSPDGRSGRIYKGTVAWTTTTISLKASVAGLAVTMMIV